MQPLAASTGTCYSRSSPPQPARGVPTPPKEPAQGGAGATGNKRLAAGDRAGLRSAPTATPRDTGAHSSWRTSLGVLYPSVAGRGRWGLARQNPRLHRRVPLNVFGFCSCLDSLTGRGTCRELIRNNGATRKSDKNNRRADDVGKRRKLVGEGNEGRAELNDRYVRCVSKVVFFLRACVSSSVLFLSFLSFVVVIGSARAGERLDPFPSLVFVFGVRYCK